MPARSPELPEGTDHIINGAMETGAGTTASTGSSGGIGGTSGGGGGATGGGSGATGSTGATGGTGATGSTGSTGGGLSTSGGTGGAFVASSGGDDTGGTSSNRGSGSRGGGATGAAKGAADKVVSGVKSQVSSLTDQATTKAREYADQGKERATSALDDFAEVINDAARSIDERLGNQYGEYAHRAAGAVTSLSQNLRGKSVDELLEDSRSAVRKSPGIAIGTAAVLGFALVRLVKAGLDDGSDVKFTPDQGRSIDFQSDAGGTSGKGA